MFCPDLFLPTAQELLAKQVSTYDEGALCNLLLEISLLDSAYQRSTPNGDEVLMSGAKRYRVDAEKLQKAVAEELAAKQDRKTTVNRRLEARRHLFLKVLAEHMFALRHCLLN
jgi:hypothetical protein